MAYFDFLKNMWVMGRLTEGQVDNAVNKGYITEQEANEIKATPKTQ